jgi:hypothetical protein
LSWCALPPNAAVPSAAKRLVVGVKSEADTFPWVDQRPPSNREYDPVAETVPDEDMKRRFGRTIVAEASSVSA